MAFTAAMAPGTLAVRFRTSAPGSRCSRRALAEPGRDVQRAAQEVDIAHLDRPQPPRSAVVRRTHRASFNQGVLQVVKGTDDRLAGCAGLVARARGLLL